jgi:hypothetical protein
MYLITRELRHARAMSIVIDRASAAQPFCSRITFTRVQGNTIQIYQSGNKLVHTSGGKTQTILQNLGYLAFTFPRSDDLAVISVALTLQQGIYLGQKKALHMASENIQVMN